MNPELRKGRTSGQMRERERQMDEASDHHHQPNEPTDLSWFDAICDGFAAAWRSGEKADIEDFLGYIPERCELTVTGQVLTVDEPSRGKRCEPIGQIIFGVKFSTCEQCKKTYARLK